MKIKNKATFAIGVVDILLSVTGAIICIINHKTRGFPMLGFCFTCGIVNIINAIETKAQDRNTKKYKW